MPQKFQRVGAHVSAAGGVENAPENARAIGAECFQFFSRSPRGGGAAVISDEQAVLFRARTKQCNMESYIHTPYYVNFASKNRKIYQGSINVVREELERGSRLGVKYVMTHMGSAKDHVISNKELATAYAPFSLSGRRAGDPSTSPFDPELMVEGSSGSRGEGHRRTRRCGVSNQDDGTAVPSSAIKQAIEGLRAIYDGEQKFSTKLLLEISAGAGVVLGDSFEELAALLKGLDRKDVFICLDTCHLFASGYDMRDAAAIEATMKQFRKHLGISRLKLVHVNDSKAALGEHKDRHEHIGKGAIGSKGFKALLAHKDFQKVNFILETKHDEGLAGDLTFLKRNRQIK